MWVMLTARQSGNWTVVLEGLCRIEVTTAVGDGPYPTCEVRQLEGLPSSDSRFGPAPYQPFVGRSNGV